jgi:predicted nucleic acid-binding protein
VSRPTTAGHRAASPRCTVRDRKPRGARAVDLLIAATALANDLPLFTRNPDHFDHLDTVGLPVHAV